MVRDNRPISDAPYDVKADVSEKPTMGTFIRGTLDSQEETLDVLDKILTTLFDMEIEVPVMAPKESIMSGLAAVLENQKAIATAVKAIIEML